MSPGPRAAAPHPRPAAPAEGDAGASPGSPGAAPARAWGLATWTVSALYLVSTLDRRWIPHDEGTLAQTAWRILHGEVPHRDFDALYTGLLGYLNAAGMAVMGESLQTPRLLLLMVFLAWVPAVWAIARRFAPPPAAALVTLLCVALGPPNYPAAMPSWYNLFLATWGVWALVKAAESGWRAGWLLAAGACAGVSVLFKVSGLYFLAAALFATLHEALLPAEPGRRSPSPWLGAAAVGLGAALLAMVLLLVRSQAVTPTGAVHYVVPVGAAVAALAVGAARAAGRARPAAEVARRWALVLAGFAAALAPFLAGFAAAGALSDLYRGVFVLPALRLERAARLPLLASGWAVAVPAALCLVEVRLRPRARLALAAAAGAAGVVLVALVPRLMVYVRLWYALALLIPLAVAAGALALRHPVEPRRRAALLAVLWAAAVTSLVQFPFSSPIYFLYVAPLAALTWLGAAAASDGSGEGLRLSRRPVTAVVWAFALGFLLVGPNRGRLFEPGRVGDTVPLPAERAGIEVQPRDAAEYGLLLDAVREHAAGEYMYATPDVPEIYFLAGLRNPTRTLFEVFDRPGGPERVLEALERTDVRVVVINERPTFSPPAPPGLVEELARRYPEGTRVGRFVVRWR